jgi:hypothetical protein
MPCPATRPTHHCLAPMHPLLLLHHAPPFISHPTLYGHAQLHSRPCPFPPLPLAIALQDACWLAGWLAGWLPLGCYCCCWAAALLISLRVCVCALIFFIAGWLHNNPLLLVWFFFWGCNLGAIAGTSVELVHCWRLSLLLLQLLLQLPSFFFLLYTTTTCCCCCCCCLLRLSFSFWLAGWRHKFVGSIIGKPFVYFAYEL